MGKKYKIESYIPEVIGTNKVLGNFYGKTPEEAAAKAYNATFKYNPKYWQEHRMIRATKGESVKSIELVR